MPLPDSPTTPRSSSAKPQVSVIALLVAMLALIIGVNQLRSSPSSTLNAGVLGTSGLLAVPAAAESDPDLAANAAGVDPVPVVTTAPLVVPTLAPTTAPFPTAPATAAAAAAVFPTATSTPVPPATAVPPTSAAPTATAAPPPTTAAVLATTESPSPTSTPLPTATTTPIATSTPLPTATTTPIPTPTTTPISTSTPVPTVSSTSPAIGPALDTGQMELYAFNAVNAVRSRAGLAPLQLRADISTIARDWSQRMAKAGGISHRPGPELGAMMPTGWRGWAENVAAGPSIEWAQTGLERSSGHYANMTGNYNSIGIGVVVAPDGQVFITQNFGLY